MFDLFIISFALKFLFLLLSNIKSDNISYIFYQLRYCWNVHSLFNVLLDISKRRLFNITFIYLRTAYGDYGATLSNKILSFKRFEELSIRRQRYFNIHHISIFSYLCWYDLRFVNRSALNFQIRINIRCIYLEISWFTLTRIIRV